MASMQNGTVLRQIDRLFGAGTVAGLSDAQLLGRFLDRRDEAAFVALVARHGPMVLAVCRGVLRDPHDAEDAFQATFMVLVRKAGSLWVGESLGGWLHRVAHRVALQARADAVRRCARERKVWEAGTGEEMQARSQDELRSVLHAEIGQLPERLRLPVVLCDLEGLTRDQAADRLRWTEGTVRGRLARARAVLRERLARRGVAPVAGSLASALAREASAASVPASLLARTARTAADQAGASAARLTTVVIRSMFLSQLKGIVAAGLTAGAVAWASVAMLAPRDGEPPAPKPAPGGVPAVAAAFAPAGRDGDGEILNYGGRVVDPGGRPVAGARQFLITAPHREPASPPWATTGPDGRFGFSLPLSAFDDPIYGRHARVAAAAEGFGVGLTDSERPDAGRDLTLKLVEDLPIEGLVVDMEGRPVAGATARVTSLWSPPGGDLTPWLRALGANEGEFIDLKYKYMNIRLPVGDQAPDLLPPAKTDAEGRFVLRGVGRERLVEVRIEAPSIRPMMIEVMTRPGGPVRVVKLPGDREAGFVTVHDARPRLVAAPTRPIEGVVRDGETGAPIAGAKIRGLRFADDRSGHNPQLETTSDARGRYRLDGMPRGSGNELTVTPPAGRPYLPALLRIDDPPGIGPIARDIRLTRGILIEGRVTDRESGEPLHAVVSYNAAADNPNLDDAPGFREIGGDYVYALKTKTGPDGSYTLAALPGRGVINVEALAREYPFLDDERRPGPPGYVPELNAAHALIETDLRRGEPARRHDVHLVRGRSISGTVRDPDGTPIDGAYVCGLEERDSWAYQPLGNPSFKVLALAPVPAADAPGPGRTLVFQQNDRKLAGWCEVGGDTPAPIDVRLVPWGVVTGRIVDRAGKPHRDVIVSVGISIPKSPEDWIGHRPGRVRTDADGRFRVEGLAPGLEYRLFVRPSGPRIPAGTLAAGEARDLGTIAVEPGDDEE